jgi:hypothetical protein
MFVHDNSQGDKHDLGFFRISDPERMLILASTDLPGLDKSPRESNFLLKAEARYRNRQRSLPHYSSTLAQLVWGEELVYKDQAVVGEKLNFKSQTMESEIA